MAYTIPPVRNIDFLRKQIVALFANVFGAANTFTALQVFATNMLRVGTDQLVTAAGRVGIGEASPDYKLDVNGTFGFTPGASVTPVDNGDVVFELTDNVTFTIKAKGADGVVRSGTVTLA